MSVNTANTPLHMKLLLQLRHRQDSCLFGPVKHEELELDQREKKQKNTQFKPSADSSWRPSWILSLTHA